MAGELDVLNVSTQQIQGASYYFLWISIGVVAGLLILFVVYRIYKSSKYKKKVIIYEKIGNREVVSTDWVAESSIDKTKMFHYRRLNKYSPVFDSKYFRLFKSYQFMGLFPKVFVGFSAFKYGDKIVPCEVQQNPGIEPVDYDAWNYLIQRLRLNQQKYETNQQLMRMLPFLALGAVVIMFIIGNLLWGQHVEKVAMEILDKSSMWATAIMEQSGGIQVIQ